MVLFQPQAWPCSTSSPSRSPQAGQDEGLVLRGGPILSGCILLSLARSPPNSRWHSIALDSPGSDWAATFQTKARLLSLGVFILSDVNRIPSTNQPLTPLSLLFRLNGGSPRCFSTSHTEENPLSDLFHVEIARPHPARGREAC